MPTYRIDGVSRETGRRRRRVYQAPDEAAAIAMAEAEGTRVEAVSELPPDPPTEAQIKLAQDLGLTLPPEPTRDEVADLIASRLDDDREPPREAEIRFAKAQGLCFTSYIGRRELARKLFSTLQKHADPAPLLQWYLYCVYRDLIRNRGEVRIQDPNDPVLRRMAVELAKNPKVVASVRRHLGPDLLYFAESSGSGCGSRRTLAYKRSAELLRKRTRIPPASDNAPNSSLEAIVPHLVDSPARPEARGCLATAALLIALPVAAAFAWLL